MTAYALNPELIAALAMLPPADITDVPAARAQFTETTAAASART